MDMLFVRRSGGCLLLVGAVALSPSLVWAANKAMVKAQVEAKADAQAQAKTKTKTKTKTSKPSSSVRFIDAPSAEKPAARERRLKRECKGRPNAGACLGYAQ